MELRAGRDGGEHRALAVIRLCQHGGHDGVRVAADQLAADHQHQVAMLPTVGLQVGAQRRGGRWAVEQMEVGFQLVLVVVPEPAEIGAALVGGVAAPQQLAAHLVRQARQEGFGEGGVGLQQGDEVGLADRAQARHQPIAAIGVQRLVHRAVEPGGGHDRLDAAVDEPVLRQPGRAAHQAPLHVGGHGGRRIDGLQQRCGSDHQRRPHRRARQRLDASPQHQVRQRLRHGAQRRGAGLRQRLGQRARHVRLEPLQRRQAG